MVVDRNHHHSIISSSIVLILLSLTLLSATIVNAAYVFKPQELESFGWLLNQTGSNLPNDPNQFCTYGQCAPSSDGYDHIVMLVINVIPYIAPSSIIPTPTSLYFPEVTSISITFPFNMSTVNVSTLSLLHPDYVPKLRTLSIINDNTIYEIPQSMTQLTALESITFGNCVNLKSVTLEYLNIQTVWFSGKYLKNFSFGTNSVINSKIKNLYIETDLTSPANLILNGNYLPNLFVLQYISSGNRANIQAINTTIDSLIVNGIVSISFEQSNYNTLRSLKVYNPSASVTPSDISTYPGLLYVEYTYLTDRFLPLSTFKPFYRLGQFSIKNSMIESIPNYPLPPTLQILTLSNNRIFGQIPLNIFSNINTPFSIDVSSNIDITGTIDQQFCKFNTYIYNTSITQVPDCFYCYFNNQTGFSSSLPPPSGFTCNVTFDKPLFPSINGFATITGNNFGFAEPPTSNYQLLVPNTKILYSSAVAAGGIKTVGFNIAGLYYKEVNIVEASIQIPLGPITVSNTNRLGLPLIFYNYYIPHTVTLKSINGQFSYPCLNPSNVSATLIQCQLEQIESSIYTITIANEFRSVSINNSITTFSPLIYPSVSSAQISTTSPIILSIYGYFGNNNLNPLSTSVIVTLNNSIPCNAIFKNQSLIQCITSELTPGQASAQISVDGFNVNFNNLISIPFPPSVDLKQQCIDSTSSCYGHGQCNDQGICICETGYFDNCKYYTNPNVSFVQNDSKPVATFEMDGYQFFFSLIAIQELDDDDQVIQELLVDQWNVTDQSNNNTQLTSLYYRLLVNSTLYPTLNTTNVTTLIEYSKQDRQVPFGDSIVSVGANNIKVGVNITGWQYQSILSHLRVVFSTIVNNEQSIESCSNGDIPTFEQILGSDSYLRVIKNDTQFYGRFLSYSYSDDRKTFSRNELINQTSIEGRSNESLALIGVHLPQCQKCLLDPDFAALVVNNEELDCSSSSSDTWKIAVGVSVGGAVFIALIIATVYYLRDSNSARLKMKDAKSIFMKKFKNTNHGY